MAATLLILAFANLCPSFFHLSPSPTQDWSIPTLKMIIWRDQCYSSVWLWLKLSVFDLWPPVVQPNSRSCQGLLLAASALLALASTVSRPAIWRTLGQAHSRLPWMLPSRWKMTTTGCGGSLESRSGHRTSKRVRLSCPVDSKCYFVWIWAPEWA